MDPITRKLDQRALHEISGSLGSLPSGDELDDILPYLTEVFEGHGVPQVRDRGKRWQAKRRTGVFYTPSDVSDFIAKETIGRFEPPNTPRCLDPACGTGVFLRSALDALLEIFPSDPRAAAKHLFGTDLSQSAVLSASFVLLSRCLRQASAVRDPIVDWWSIRENLVAIDSTTLSFRSESVTPMFRAPTQIPLIFPDVRTGFDVVLGNPPYSDLPRDQNHLLRRQLFSTVPSSGAVPAYPLFVEMMWRLSNPRRARSGMVVPLSIAYNSGTVFKTLRRELQRAHATWQFYFFDRTPDSLFGDDVKTRAAILIMERSNGVSPSIQTSPLIRWNSRMRNHLFRCLPSVQLREQSIEAFIPKLGSEAEVEAWTELWSKQLRLGDIWIPTSQNAITPDERDIFHYSTAYNWLSVMRSLPHEYEADGKYMLPPSLKRLRCRSEADAWFTFGVLSSRLAYWLWRVSADGFHLNRGFLESVPVHPSLFSDCGYAEVCSLARKLWAEMEERPTIATNGGAISFGFSPVGSERLLAEIDARVIKELGLPCSFVAYLDEFVQLTIKAGREAIAG